MKRWIAILTALALLLAAAGCSRRKPRRDPAATDENGQLTQPTAPSSMSMLVDRDTGILTITRPELNVTETMGEQDTWTVFLYLCGADLESDGGMASGDLRELLEAKSSDKVRFVVQTGGAWSWEHDAVNSRKTQRFLIENGKLTEVGALPTANMGAQQTLADFLRWGVETYPAQRMGVILWDHGGGSITGVCFDETQDWDSLSLRELDGAFLSAYGSMTDKFEFVGFDACLMGTVETANVLASYARYLYASEETEPGSGWDYTAIGSYLAAHPDADGEALGREVCDSFYEACAWSGDEQSVTLAVVDLSKIDGLLQAYNSFTESMYRQSDELSRRTAMVREILAAENFGGNNWAEGYTNMVDLGGIVDACASYADGGAQVRQALREAVVYQVNGSDHPGACGLATYYPLEIQGSEELTIFADLCVSPYYMAFVDRIAQGGADAQAAEDYDEDIWFDDGEWNSSGEDNAGMWTEDEYWGFLDDESGSTDSTLITFYIEPTLDEEDGSYYFVLTDEALDYTASVYALVYELSSDGEDLIEIGETYDVLADWDYGLFQDNFDGWWLSLPDGQNLALCIAETTEEYVVYTSPVRLNGEETNLRLRQTYDGVVTVEGAWGGIDEYGAASRIVTKLQAGDRIQPLYNAYSLESDWEGLYSGSEYVLDSDTLEICYQLMEEGDYYYAFCVCDVYGGSTITDGVMFEVDADGSVYYDLT